MLLGCTLVKETNHWMACAVARLLLRVRLLYYLKQEMIGSEAEKVLCGAPAR